MLRPYRYDSGTIISTPVKDEKTGYWRIEATVCRDGVLVYQKCDSLTRKEFRPPEENQRLASILNQATFPFPVTIEHPPAPVDASNASRYMVGIHGRGEARYSSPDLIVPLYYYVDTAIEDITSGKRREVSLGYFCRTVEEPGTWKGERYDAVQLEVEPNHFATTMIARAGKEAKLHLDSINNLYDFAYRIHLDSQDAGYDREIKTDRQYFFMDQMTYSYKRDGGSEVSVSVPSSVMPILNDKDNTIASLQSQLQVARNDAVKVDELTIKLDSVALSAERYRGAHDEVSDRLRVASDILEKYNIHYDSVNNQWYQTDSDEDEEDKDESYSRFDAKSDEEDSEEDEDEEEDDDEELLSELNTVLSDLKKESKPAQKSDSFLDMEEETTSNMNTTQNQLHSLTGGADPVSPSTVFQAIKMFPSLESRFDSAYPKSQDELLSIVATEARKEMAVLNPGYKTDSLDDLSAIEAYKFASSLKGVSSSRSDSTSNGSNGNHAFNLDAILSSSYRGDGKGKKHDFMEDEMTGEDMPMTPEQAMESGYKKKRGYQPK